MSHIQKQFPFGLLHFYVFLVCRSWSQNVRWACRAVNMMLKHRDQTPGHREEKGSWHPEKPMGISTNVVKPPALKDTFCSCHNSPAFPQQQNPVRSKFKGQNYSRPHLLRGKFISVCHQIKAVVWTDNGEQQHRGEDGVLKIIWRWIEIPGWRSQAHRIEYTPYCFCWLILSCGFFSFWGKAHRQLTAQRARLKTRIMWILWGRFAK